MFITTDTQRPQFMPYPTFLLEMNLSETAKLIYVLLLYRSQLSVKNGWLDKGRVYVVFTIESLAQASHKSQSTVKAALTALEMHGLISRQRCGLGQANRIFVKIPSASPSKPVISPSKTCTYGDAKNRQTVVEKSATKYKTPKNYYTREDFDNYQED